MVFKNLLQIATKQATLIFLAILLPLFLMGFESKTLDISHLSPTPLPSNLALEQPAASSQTKQEPSNSSSAVPNSQKIQQDQYNPPKSKFRITTPLPKTEPQTPTPENK